ncbi:sigma-E factor negative regulatory protein [Lysobacter soli]|uniref:sigma-E factor negative regulatory protein n=1 Tax=Lysobacter soli TaxID=453783 RepID=UPI00209F03F5|nr:sigma-E factor negative regulatory protein [Lysobacter soli]UTA52603.1 sigma-E factor negative regulatory protein [Lysobacter soli]
MTSNHRPIDDRPAHSSDERETLCALFDGELAADEARFALKRLGHDAEWRDTVGRWQLYGDALRGQAQGVAANGFADRVALALREEQSQPVALPARSFGGRRGWMGGALAASVAVAALFVTRPFSDDPTSSGSSVSPNVASVPAASLPRVAAAAASRASTVATPRAPAAPADPQSPDSTLGATAAAVAVAEVPRRASERRASRSQSQRSPARSGRQVEQPAIASAAVPQAAIADTALPAPQHVKPFQPEHVEVASRPWPRAVLPQYSGNGALTASFGTSSAASPSFYPFEPQTATPTVEDAPAQRGPQD